ncbi:ABC transporter ATP-binding protein [Pedobacter yonginense]|uniref:ABC transporter ATP-binding protein n=1 Tax=Pedobacter yonginense TaxID=651869 RepID=A0A317EN77_9SPHI|nr:peptidase domain-containing ABC transporter [Pedobacter yonginense]PWS26508.1 ABC transporter ATP-binding protein [Pedobacter yonginense]
MKKFPFYKQPDSKDCGPTCLRIVAKYYNKVIPLQQVRNLSETTREGSSLLGLSDAAENIGFKSLGVKINFEILKNEVSMPCIVHWNKVHFVVVYKIDKQDKVHISDPSYGLITYSKQEFLKFWIGNNAHEKTEEGVALLLETTPKFSKSIWEDTNSKTSFSFLFAYLNKYKSLVLQLIIGLAAGSLFSLIFPFLTQSIVDIGIQNQDLNFIYLVLAAQVMLFIGSSSIEIIRSWILLHLSTRINISIVSDFFIKLMKLPIGFFDTRMTGDIMQRINDHHRIEQFLTNATLSTLFSLFNFIVFSCILAYYNIYIFLVFLFSSLCYLGWILFFLKKRRELDYKRFSQVSEEQSKVIELVNGMQEIKIHNAEKQKRWAWEFVQIKLFKVGMQALTLEQYQSVGSSLINQLKNIVITFLSASLVIKGDLTLGMMLSVQYIIGQLDAPLSQMVNFFRQMQDAKISLERLGEIHDKQDEEPLSPDGSTDKIHDIEIADIELKNLSFRYTGSPDFVVDNISFVIPKQKTTAIVGASGSGKTTLMKLLMKFYDPVVGEVKVGHHNLINLSQKSWRDLCGVVMQDGFIFNDTIANNIAIGEDFIDKKRLLQAVETANIKEYIESLPLSYNSKIGNEGIGMSGGQRQRILIARAVYKNPAYIFFDEATSALDANTEKVIIENLNEFLKNKTAVIVAHRLSTVKHADKIIVMDKGKIIEEGTHKDLVALRGEYYRLVKNQLELGN